MSEEQANGGTPGQQAPASYTQEQVDAMMVEAKKAATNEVWSKFQSDKDKEVSQYRDIAEQASKALKDIEASQEQAKVANMSAEEKAAYYAEKMYRQASSVDSKPAPDPKQSSSPSAGGAPTAGSASDPNSPDAGQAKAILVEAAKNAGIDPETIDLNNGIDGFLKSVVATVKPKETPEERNAKLEKEKEANASLPSSSGNGDVPLTKRDPLDMIRSGGAKQPFKTHQMNN